MKKRLLGAHTSIAGGCSLAVDRAARVNFLAAQIFTKSNHQWAAKPFDENEVKAFRSKQEKSGIFFFGHTGYLINCGSPKEDIFEKSIASLTDEIERGEALGLPFLVLHPGSHVGSGEENGFKRIVSGLNKAIQNTKKMRLKIALEITAGQGSNLGYEFEHLALLLSRVKTPSRFGVCLDTAHLFAAGYDLRTPAAYRKTMKDFEKIIGKEWLLGMHLNDSKTPFNSRKDRHEHLGEGHIGIEAFRLLVQDPRWKNVPMTLETPKSADMQEDVENLKKLYAFL